MKDKYDDAGILIRPIVKLEIDMDIEQLQIRMGEMAAEIERLQSVIDEANAQEPVYFWREIGEGDWMQCHKDWYYKCVDSAEHDTKILYARPIPAQQSPAVAATEFEEPDCPHCGGVMNGDCFCDEPKLPPPRITEQDFIEIIKSYMQVSIPYKVTFESWMSAGGRALLDKLNEEK